MKIERPISVHFIIKCSIQFAVVKMFDHISLFHRFLSLILKIYEKKSFLTNYFDFFYNVHLKCPQYHSPIDLKKKKIFLNHQIFK